MDKAAAQKLVRETLQGSFNKERFVSLIKNLLNHVEEAPFTYKGQYIFSDFQDSIKLVERIGKYKGSDEKLFDILVIHLQKETSLERARTKQRNFVAKYLKGSRGDVLKDAALVAFVAQDDEDWRFSFIKMEYKFNEKGKVKEEFTPARRYSFLVGKNENSHTAQSRLLPLLLDDEGQPTLKDLEDAFSVEKATKEFFEKYRALFIRLKENLDKIVKKDQAIKTEFENKKVNTVDFAKKLLGQIVFLYFLQKKGWFGVGRDDDWGAGSKHFLRELFEKRHADYKNFFNDILEPLFYEALRNDHSHDDDYYSHFNCKIPFLNGGLFDPIGHYDWVHTDIDLPNALFSNTRTTKEGDAGDGILDVFDRYNFTVREDEPLEKEVAIDPELLGKAYEKFNAIRPDNFDEFQKTLKSGNKGEENKFNKKFGVYYTPREIVHYMCQQSLINYLATELEDKIDKKDIETLIHIGEQVSENEARVLREGRETDTYSHKLPESIRPPENAALIDQKLSDITVCDPAVGSGAFPVGMMNEIVRTRNVLSVFLNDNTRNNYECKRHCIEHSLYGVDIDSGAVEIAKLRLWLSLVVDEQDRETIQPLPNLDYKIVCGNSLLGVNKLFNHESLKKLEELKPLYFNETSVGKKQKQKKQIDDLISQITNGHKDFDFEVYFSEVFHEEKGFDVVIANPPYVKEYVNRSAFDGVRDSPYYKGKMDLWYMFACRGVDVLRANGILTFIAQNNWVTSHGASKMRNKVIQDTQILSLIDFGAFKVFEAGIQTMVMIFKKSADVENYSFDYRRLLEDDLKIDDGIVLLNKGTSSKTEYLTPKIERGLFINKLLTFSASAIQSILEKISEKSDFVLNPKKEAAQGIVCPQDYLNKAGQKVLGANFKIGEGIFTLSTRELKALQLSKTDLQLIKPFYTTDELNRWKANPHNRKWIIYTDSSFKDKKKLESYPNIKKHLDRFKKIITSDNKPYGLHRARDAYFFKEEKIIAVRKCARPTFTYVDFDSYVSATFYVIKTERINQKCLVGVLNSLLIEFWLRHKGKMQGTNYQIDKEPLVNLPLVKADENTQEAIANVIDKILAITKDDDYLENSTKQAKVRECEKQIDCLVYKLYDLSPEEIEIVENSYSRDFS